MFDASPWEDEANKGLRLGLRLGLGIPFTNYGRERLQDQIHVTVVAAAGLTAFTERENRSLVGDHNRGDTISVIIPVPAYEYVSLYDRRIGSHNKGRLRQHLTTDEPCAGKAPVQSAFQIAGRHPSSPSRDISQLN